MLSGLSMRVPPHILETIRAGANNEDSIVRVDDYGYQYLLNYADGAQEVWEHAPTDEKFDRWVRVARQEVSVG